MAEGSIWEAFEHAAHYSLDNLTAILDANRLGQRGETMVGRDLDVYVERARAFGWHAVAIDGHDVGEIDRAYAHVLETTDKPTLVVARTVKGKGVKAVEDENGFHGKPLDDPEEAIEELGGLRQIRIEVAKPDAVEPHRFPTSKLELPRYELGSEIATRKAYGEALAALGAPAATSSPSTGGLQLDVRGDLREGAPRPLLRDVHRRAADGRGGCGSPDRRLAPFASTFAAFLSRAYDFVRMAAVSRARLAFSGSHAGVSIGEDGPSQMGLEDIAAFRAIHGSVVLHPCDGNQTAKLVAAMADFDGISYLRTLRPATAVIYGPDEEFDIGGSRVVRSSDDDEIALIAAGITLPEALKAADALAEDGIAARVIDYSIKPLDVETLLAAAEATGSSRHDRGSLARRRSRRSSPLGARKHGRAAASRQARGAGDAELGKARAAARGRRHRRGAHRRGGPHAHRGVVGASRAVGAVGAERRPRSGLRLHARQAPLAAAAQEQPEASPG